MPEAVSSNDCKRLVSEARVAGRKAWEAGVRQAYEWKSAAILSLIEASQG